VSRKPKVLLNPFPHLHIRTGEYSITAKASKDQRLKGRKKIIKKAYGSIDDCFHLVFLERAKRTHIFIYRLNTWESAESGTGTNFINLYCVGSESMNGFK